MYKVLAWLWLICLLPFWQLTGIKSLREKCDMKNDMRRQQKKILLFAYHLYTRQLLMTLACYVPR